MSLQAKIEAVIYASEEPVTLQQLVGLLGEEAQAELDAADARQGQLALTGPALVLEEVEANDEDALNAEVLDAEDFAAVAPEDETAVARSETEPTPDAPLEPGAGEVSAADESASAGSLQLDPSPAATEPQAPLAEAAPADPTPAEVRARERRLREYMRSVLDRLIADYRTGDRGLEIREIAGGFRFATKPEYHDAVRGFVRSLKPPLKLSLQALETLAVVAYKQPVTAPEVSEVRGVDSGGVLGSLLSRKLVATAGRKQVIGRPILYKTTREFLLRFGLKDLSELPSIEEFERMASDLNGALQEEIEMPENTIVPVATAAEAGPISTAEVEQDVEESRDIHMAQADGDPNPSTPSADEVSEENLTPAPDGPGEFTGNESAPPADNSTVDGRISGLPPVYDTLADEMTDSPANDAAAQSAQSEQPGNAGADD